MSDQEPFNNRYDNGRLGDCGASLFINLRRIFRLFNLVVETVALLNLQDLFSRRSREVPPLQILLTSRVSLALHPRCTSRPISAA